MSGMEFRPSDLSPLATDAEGRVTPSSPVKPFAVNSKAAELLADLIESTALASTDRLALVRGRTRQGETFVDALVAEGLA